MVFSDTLASGRVGDQKALEDLFDRWRPLLKLQASQMLGADLAARVDPSDIVQDAFAQAGSELESFRGHDVGQWVAWLKALVAGHAAKTLRFHRAEKRDPLAEVSGVETCAANRAPEENVIVAEEAAVIAGAIERLPDSMRNLIHQRVFLDQPWEQVGAALGKNAGACRVLWTRTLRRLRAELNQPPSKAEP